MRPICVAAQRQRELMAVTVYESAEDIEWLDEQYLDTSDVPVAEPDDNCEEQITVITTYEHLCSPWTEL